MEVIVEFEGRSRIVRLKRNGTEADLRSSFQALCVKDPVLKIRCSTHYATFRTFNQRHKCDIELEPGETLRDGQTVKVFFASFAAIESSEVGDHSLRENTGSAAGPTNDDNDLYNFIQSIGVHTDSSNASNAQPGQSTLSHRVSTAQPGHSAPSQSMSISTVQSTQSTTPSQRGSVQKNKKTSTATGAKNRNTKKQNEDCIDLFNDSDDELMEESNYLPQSIQSKEANSRRLQELNIGTVASSFNVPKLDKTRRPKKNGTGDKENRIMPPRAVKAKKAPHPDTALLEEEEEIENVESESAPPEQDQGPLDNGSTKQKTKAEPVIRRKPQRRRRCIGEKITSFTPLPEFSKELKESIQRNLVYVHQKHTQRMNDFLIKHIENVTNDQYCTKKEHKILRDQVVNRLRSMNVQNIGIYENKLVSSLSASLRNKRNYIWNKLPKRISERTAAPVVEHNRENIRELTGEEADELLRKPVIVRDTVKRDLDADSPSLRNSFMRQYSVRECIDTYPYLKDIDLLLHDYSTRIGLKQELIKNNFEEALLPLAAVFSVNEVPTDELGKFQLIMKINDYFDEHSATYFPCIQLWDEANSGAHPLNNIPTSQAPALVTIVNDKEIVSAVLVFDTECLYTMKKRAAFDCVALLLSCYFVFQIEYPRPYVKVLHTIQHILHGERNYHDSVKGFFRTFNRARKIISQQQT